MQHSAAYIDIDLHSSKSAQINHHGAYCADIHSDHGLWAFRDRDVRMIVQALTPKTGSSNWRKEAEEEVVEGKGYVKHSHNNSNLSTTPARTRKSTRLGISHQSKKDHKDRLRGKKDSTSTRQISLT